MEANLKAAAQALPRPTCIEEVDAWMANYLALIDEARAEAVRVERLRNAAPDLLDALYRALPFVEEAETDPHYKTGEAHKVVVQMRAAIAKASA